MQRKYPPVMLTVGIALIAIGIILLILALPEVKDTIIADTAVFLAFLIAAGMTLYVLQLLPKHVSEPVEVHIRHTIPADQVHDLIRRTQQAITSYEQLSQAFTHVHTDKRVLVERPLILDVTVLQTAAMVERFNELTCAVNEVKPQLISDPDMVQDHSTLDHQNLLLRWLNHHLSVAQEAFNVADVHSRRIGIPNTTEAQRDRGRSLINVVLDDRNHCLPEREEAWAALTRMVENAGVNPVAIQRASHAIAEIMPSVTSALPIGNHDK